jgi:beta-phosphoglucomutase
MRKNIISDMHIKACIFDLDGVIVDTAKYHFKAWKRLTDQMGISFTEADNERLKGVSRMASLDIILELGGISLPEKEKLEYATLKNEWYVEYISMMTPDEILPGTVKFLTELREANIKTAIGSASKNTPMILERTGIKNLFDGVADGNNVKNAKPDPEVFQTAARLIKVKDEECVVFEDAIAGIQAALNAGMKSIGIGSGDILREAHLVISGLSEMNLEKLKQFEKAN